MIGAICEVGVALAIIYCAGYWHGMMSERKRK